MGEKYSGRDVLDLMKSAKQYNNYLSSLCEELVKDKNVKIVDFGAGIGTISEILAQKGFNIECIELDDEQRQVIQNKGLNAHEDLAYLDDSSVDMFISFNVFEHIKNDKCHDEYCYCPAHGFHSAIRRYFFHDDLVHGK